MSQKLSFKTQLLPTMLSIGDQEPFAANSLKPMGFMIAFNIYALKRCLTFQESGLYKWTKAYYQEPSLISS